MRQLRREYPNIAGEALRIASANVTRYGKLKAYKLHRKQTLSAAIDHATRFP